MPIPSRPPLRLLPLALLALGLGASLAVAHAAVPEPSEGTRLLGYAGDARSPDSGSLIYVEEHLLREQAGQPVERLVLYRCADGTPFARKQVEYGTQPFAPAFELVDARLGYREGLRREGEAWIVFGGAGERAQQTPLDEVESIVADAGFEPFVRQHWAQLQAGESVPIDFLVPSRARSYGFRLSKVEALQIEGEAASRMRLSLSGVFGLFAPAIDVIYRDSDQWLLRFEGMTNIRESARENVVAHIAFPQTPQPVAAERWAQASAEPLQSCALPAAG